MANRRCRLLKPGWRWRTGCSHWGSACGDLSKSQNLGSLINGTRLLRRTAMPRQLRRHAWHGLRSRSSAGAAGARGMRAQGRRAHAFVRCLHGLALCSLVRVVVGTCNVAATVLSTEAEEKRTVFLPRSGLWPYVLFRCHRNLAKQLVNQRFHTVNLGQHRSCTVHSLEDGDHYLFPNSSRKCPCCTNIVWQAMCLRHDN
mmetsp:Transcript_17350/g.54348  ORF Transcript_17350/g.54348 Transcript_17350/m.54348 type:complete len:200 (+) Transcript_17350:704-1303(+)